MRRALLLCLVPCIALTSACSTMATKKRNANYRPSESIIEVVSVLRRHLPDDTYRFPPATDFTGRNVYRASLLRLEGIEQIHADALRSGYMNSVVSFSKARALERLRGFDLAAEHYREAARYRDELEEEAKRSAEICDRIAAANSIGLQLRDPLASSQRESLPDDPAVVLAGLEERVARLHRLHDELAGTHYAVLLREEVERADEIRAGYFLKRRHVLKDGQLRSAAELQRLVERHGKSKRHLRHLLLFATFYDELAHEYVAAIPPESLRFDPARFRELVGPASQLYQAVTSQDGTLEKLEAARRLEAFLAFTLRVDSDRFTQ